MKFHSIHIELYGNLNGPLYIERDDLDIADLFYQFSNALGFEGNIDRYAGLWSTRYTYDTHSLISIDFLSNGLYLDIICDANKPIPFTSLLLTLETTLSTIAHCSISNIIIDCHPSSVIGNFGDNNHHSNLMSYLSLIKPPKTAPNISFSNIEYTINYSKRNTHNVLNSTYHASSFSELSLVISSFWNQYIKEKLNESKMVSLKIS